MHLGHGGLDGPAEVDVVRAVELGRQPRLDAHLGGAHLPGLHGAADDFLRGRKYPSSSRWSRLKAQKVQCLIHTLVKLMLRLTT